MTAIALPRTSFPLYEQKVRSRLDDLITKFMPAFGKGFSSPIASPGVAAIPRWLTGGIAAANCIAAYDAKNAASLAASYINLAKPGTYNLTTASAPGFGAGVGWTFNGIANNLRTSVFMGVTQNVTGIIRISSISRPAGWVCAFGNDCGGGKGHAIFSAAATTWQIDNGSYRNFTSSGATSGVFAFSGNVFYINGAAQTGAIGDASFTDGEIYIGSSNIGSNCAEVVTQLALYNLSYNATINLALATAMAAL